MPSYFCNFKRGLFDYSFAADSIELRVEEALYFPESISSVATSARNSILIDQVLSSVPGGGRQA